MRKPEVVPACGPFALLLLVLALAVAAAGGPAAAAAVPPSQEASFAPSVASMPAPPPSPSGNHPGPVTTKYAVLINGNSGSDVPFLNNMSFMYKTLINQYGFLKKNIFVVSFSGYSYDLDKDGFNDVNYMATRANINAVFDTLDYNRDVDGDDLVFIYLTDHGSQTPGYNESCLNLYNSEYLHARDLERLLTQLDDQDVVNYWPNLLVVLDPCYGGGFTDSVLPYPKRAICTASKASEGVTYWPDARPDEKYASSTYTGFTYYWISAMNGADPDGKAVDADANDDGHVSFKEAFDYAKANDEFANEGSETPQYFDFSDGYGSQIALDGTALGGSRAGLCRGQMGRVYCGGADVWGDGGRGLCGASGIAATRLMGAAAAAGKAASLTGTTELSAVVRNSGSEPVSNVLVRFYYGVPATIAWASDTSLHYVGSATWSLLAPGDTAVVGPVTCTLPELNPLGQPYWRVLATVEADGSPPESGWVESDFHVGVENYHRANTPVAEPMELRFQVRNPEPVARRIVLRPARSTLPEGWVMECSPALGETLDVAPGADLAASVTLIPDGVHGPTGVVTIEEELLKPFAGCDIYCTEDSIPEHITEGGFLRTTGGISFEVTAPFIPTAVVFSKLAAAWSEDGILVSWWGHPGAGHHFELARRSPGTGDFMRLASFGSDQTGTDGYQYLDRDVVAGEEYTYRVDYVGPQGLAQSFPPIAVRAGSPDWRVSAGYPNPSAGEVSVNYSMPFRSPVRITVFDVAGRLVRRVDLGVQGPGTYSFTWDGKDARGVGVPAGAYVVRLKTGERAVDQRVVVVR